MRHETDTNLKHGLHGHGGHHGRADLLAVAQLLAHNEQHRRGEGERGDPRRADELFGSAAGHDALGFERVADGQVALDAQAGDIEHGGVGAAVPEKVVAATHGVAEHPGVVEPDKVVELDGHRENKNEKVGDGEADQVVVHGALEVVQALFGQQDIEGDGVAQRAHSEQNRVDDCDYHLGVNVRVDFQVFVFPTGVVVV